MKKYLTPFLMGVLLIRPIPIDHAQAIALAPSTTTGTAASTVAQAVKPALTVLQEVSVFVTAYASVPEETDNSPFITASNKHVQDGFIATNFLPFGTLVKIPAIFGDKIFTVEDRMNRRMVGFVDVWMPTVAEAKDFGIHKAQIVVLSKPGDSLAVE